MYVMKNPKESENEWFKYSLTYLKRQHKSMWWIIISTSILSQAQVINIDN